MSLDASLHMLTSGRCLLEPNQMSVLSVREIRVLNYLFVIFW